MPVHHVAVDATRLLRDQRGIGRYVRNVLRELSTLAPELRVTLHVDPGDGDETLRLLHTIAPAFGARASCDDRGRLHECHADVAWYPWNILTPPLPACARVVTTHDLAPMLRHDHRWWRVLKRLKYRRRFAFTMRHADLVLTDCEAIREELVTHFGVSRDRLAVALLAADDLPVVGAEDDTPLRSHEITGPFFLTVGGQEPRKNLPTLYEAMARLWATGVRVPLVQCGPDVSAATRALLGEAPWLKHVGFVTDAQLVTLYRQATALVYPSRYEGFGLPILEAMRAGGVVICADGSSLPEVAGDAALMVPWHDADALAAAMREMHTDPAAARVRRALGPAQAARFTWRATAEATLEGFARAQAQSRERR
jgi:glycosyltransferase involved in cell wall biosynthesis